MEQKVLEVIKAIRESFGASIAVYSFGNCYQLYEILKVVFPEAEAFDVGGHTWSKINNNFYDIRGKQDPNKVKMIKVEDPERIKTFCVNKWTDERRKEFGMGEELNKKIKEAKENGYL